MNPFLKRVEKKELHKPSKGLKNKKQNMTNMDIYKNRECKPTFCMDENVWQAPASMHQCLHRLKTFRPAKKPTNASYLVMKNPLLAPNKGHISLRM